MFIYCYKLHAKYNISARIAISQQLRIGHKISQPVISGDNISSNKCVCCKRNNPVIIVVAVYFTRSSATVDGPRDAPL